MIPARPHGLRRRSRVASRRLAASAALLVVTALPPGAFGADDPTRVRLDTSLGEIVLELDPRRAPASVENFLGYVDDDFYDGTIFHRVIEGFMIQGGGFDPGFTQKPTGAPIRNEANNGLSNRRYTISMARTNQPHSATAQFFINTVDNANLDHRGATPRGWGYAVFGRVVEGQDVVERIGRVPTGAGGPFGRDVPRTPVVIVEAARVAPDSADGVPATGAVSTDTTAPTPSDDEATTSAVSDAQRGGARSGDDAERVDPL